MKILSVEKYYFVTGGASRVFFETNELLEKKGHQVIPFAGKYPQNFETNFSKYFVPRFTKFSGDNSRKVTLLQKIKAYFDAIYAFDVKRSVNKLLNDEKPDIAHLHTILYQISPSIIRVLKQHSIPVVQTLHDFIPVCATRYLYSNGEICERCKNSKYYNILLQNCYNKNFLTSFMSFSATIMHRLLKLYPDKVNLFIAPSKFLKNKMIEFGIPGKKIIHISHFIPASKFPSPNYNHKNYFLFAGYLVKQKGIYTLLEAMKKIKKGRLIIAGRGPERENIENFVKKNNLKNVEIIGFLNDKDLYQIIRNAMFVVFPSEGYETFGMGILESYMLGKPVIASDIGAYPEVVIPYETGLLFQHGNYGDLAEKIKVLIENEEMRKIMGKNARDFATENFNENIYYEKLINIYESLIK
jgi:glycosyltransferase involved in cell wall biosynthesis